MPPDRNQIAAVLKDTHLCRTLDEDQIARVMEVMETGTLPPGQRLFNQKDPAQFFYIILTGHIRLVRFRKGKEKTIATLGPGEYFGEEALHAHGVRPVTAFAEEVTQVLRLDTATLKQLFQEIPALKANLEIAIATHYLLQRVHLEWLNPDEIVFLMARRHVFYLYEVLIGPVVALLISVVMMGLFYFQIWPGRLTPLLATGLLELVSLGWGVWVYLDWSNDYNIVTNQRVVWLEKVAGIYDSRQEAPLTTLLSVGIRTTQIGRWIGSGDVLVRTYTGVMALRQLANPDQTATLIEENWTRSKEISRQVEREDIEQTIRQRLGLDPSLASEEPKGEPKTYHEVTIDVKPGWLQSLFANFFHVRFEDGPIVTYRKHWFVLVRMTWQPVFWLGVTAGLAFLRLTNWFTLLSHAITFALCAGAGIGSSLWFLYNYLDWRNDVYQVTPDQIVDLERKPLGKEERRAAPLENILSIEYQRLGIMGLLLNFGTVTLTVGATRFTFDYVYNPSQVQQDVFRRMNERIENRKRAEALAQRERISDWITIYHQNLHPQVNPGPNDLSTDVAGDGN